MNMTATLGFNTLLAVVFLEVALCCTSRPWLQGHREPNQELGLRHFVRSALERRDEARSLKRQAVIPDTTPFPCDLSQGRSAVRPSSVHRLRPGDIDVVGAIGDSITAAWGAVALDMHSVLVGNRGVSFSIGGEETWRTTFTLPNVLKLYNPKLVGFSLGDGFVMSRKAQLNVAEGFAASTDMLFLAKLLVQKIRSDRRINVNEDWKMVTIFMGANDFCHWICYVDPKYFIANHRKDLIDTLNYLRDNLPRLFINFVLPPNIYKRFLHLTPPDSCFLVNNIECSCFFNRRYKNKQLLYDEIMEEWQRVDLEITGSPEYQNKEDFTIVVQPFTLDVAIPQLARRSSVSGKPLQDSTFYAPDCFHFSQKMHSVAANALWNNLMQPDGTKSRGWNQRLLEDFICPNETHPYFYTRRNSVATLR